MQRRLRQNRVKVSIHRMPHKWLLNRAWLNVTTPLCYNSRRVPCRVIEPRVASQFSDFLMIGVDQLKGLSSTT